MGTPTSASGVRQSDTTSNTMSASEPKTAEDDPTTMDFAPLLQVKQEVLIDEYEDIAESDPPSETTELEQYVHKLEETLELQQSEKERLLKEVVDANTKCLQHSYQLNIERENVRRLQIESMRLRLDWQKRFKELNDNLSIYKAAVQELEVENRNLRNGAIIQNSGEGCSKSLELAKKLQFEDNGASNNGFTVKKEMENFIMEPAISIIEQDNGYEEAYSPQEAERVMMENENGALSNIVKNIVIKYPKLTIGPQTCLQRKGLKKQVKTQRRMATKRRIWDKDMMRAAVYAVRTKKMGFKKAAKVYNVPKTTLQCYSKQPEENIEKVISRPIGRKTTLPTEIETKLVDYSKKMDKIFYGLSTTDLRQIAFQIAIRNGIKHPFSHDNNTAGRGWLRRFSNRHPEVSVKIHRPSAKYLEYNLKYVTKFYSNLRLHLNSLDSRPEKVYNVDESGFLLLDNKMVQLRTEDQIIDHLKVNDHPKYLTLVSCASASGTYLPPMLISAQPLDPETAGLEPGALLGHHPSGWISDELFLRWFQELFLPRVRPSREQPCLLVVNGYTGHKCNVGFVDVAQEHGVQLLCVPPSSSELMQPLRKEFVPRLIQVLGEVKNSLFESMVKAWTKVSAQPNFAIQGFRETGILPYNPSLVVTSFKPEKVGEEMSGQNQQTEQSAQKENGKRWTSPRKRVKKKRWDSSSDDFIGSSSDASPADWIKEEEDTEVLIKEDPGANNCQMSWFNRKD